MKLLVCDNPFNPARDTREVETAPEQTLELALAGQKLDVERNVLSLNGEILPPERSLSFVPAKDDCVVVMPRIANNLERAGSMMLLALVASAVATAMTEGLASPIFGSALFAAFTGAVITAGGTLLINFVASLLAPKDGGAAYTWTGPQTSSRSGLPIPKGFGLIRNGGNIVMSWVDLQNADSDTPDGTTATIGRQWINVLVCFGFGPVNSITDIRINDRDIETFSDVALFTRLGTQGQTMPLATDPSWVKYNITTTGDAPNTNPTVDFTRVANNYPITQRVFCGRVQNYVIVLGQRNDTTQLDVIVQFPLGVYRITGDGNKVDLNIYYNVYYRVQGTEDWTLAKEHCYNNSRDAMLRQVTTITGLAAGCYDVMVEKIACQWTGGFGLQYSESEVDTVGDELWIEAVQESFSEVHNYPNMIMLGIRIMATDQLSGSGVNVTALVDFGCRQERPAELAAYADNNPAVVAYDILTDPIVGGGLNPSCVDLDSFAEWADLCITQMPDGDGNMIDLAAFNGIFDQSGSTVWDAFQTVCVLGRAMPLRIGTQVSVALDAPAEPAQMFSVSNIVKDSYSKKYLNIDDRAQTVEVNFSDAADDYKTRTPERVILAQDQGSGELFKFTRVSLLGCTSRPQAYYWATHHLLMNELQLRMHAWQSPAQAIVSRIGNVVWLQHDVPQWADGGMIVGGDVSHVTLDRNDLVWDGTNTYTLLVLHPALKRYTNVTVIGIDGNTLSVTGFDGVNPVKRALVGEIDVAIDEYESGSITVFDLTGITNGTVLTLWDTDVIESRVVSALEGNVATLATPLSAAPTPQAGYIYQSTVKAAIKVRLTSMKDTGDQKYQLTAVDYIPAVYTLPPPDSTTDSIPSITPKLYYPTANSSTLAGITVTNPTAPYSLDPTQFCTISLTSAGGGDQAWSTFAPLSGPTPGMCPPPASTLLIDFEVTDFTYMGGTGGANFGLQWSEGSITVGPTITTPLARQVLSIPLAPTGYDGSPLNVIVTLHSDNVCSFIIKIHDVHAE